MDIKAAEVKLLELFVEDKSVGLFKVVSEWEGFQKLKCLTSDTVVIVIPPKDDSLTRALDEAFSNIYGNRIVHNMKAIAASPNFIFKTEIELQK